MYEELYEPLPDPERYWERLGIDPSHLTIDTPALDRIIFAHQRAIPFENLDACEYRIPISLGTVDMFEKIILGMRGGYCFELNALFTTLLSEVGFHAAPCFARSLRDVGYLQPIAHRGTIVTIDGMKAYCDVGYGGPLPACSIPLLDGLEISLQGQTFRIERADTPWWRILYCGRQSTAHQSPEDAVSSEEEISSKISEPVLAFMDVPQHEVDFVALSHYCSTHPDSIFTRQRMINRATDTGSVSITANRFMITDYGVKTQERIETDREFHALLIRYFGINPPVSD